MSGTWAPAVGECLFIESGPAGKHLFVVLLGYRSPRGQAFILVPICSSHAKADPACSLKVGDHPFILHDSFLDYRNAREDLGETLSSRVSDHTFVPDQKASAELVKKAIAGLKASKFVSRHFKDICAKHG